MKYIPKDQPTEKFQNLQWLSNRHYSILKYSTLESKKRHTLYDFKWQIWVSNRGHTSWFTTNENIAHAKLSKKCKKSAMGKDTKNFHPDIVLPTCQYPLRVTGTYVCFPLKCFGSTPPNTSSPPSSSPTLRLSQKENTGSLTRPCSTMLYLKDEILTHFYHWLFKSSLMTVRMKMKMHILTILGQHFPPKSLEIQVLISHQTWQPKT